MLALPYRSMIDRVIIALLDSPFAVNELRNESKNKKYFDKLIYSLLPADVGIEIEVPLQSAEYEVPKWISKYKLETRAGMANTFNNYLHKDFTKKALLKGVNERELRVHSDSGCYEITHHMPKGKLYKYVWAILESANRSDAVRKQGGSIHYHIDISKHIKYTNANNCTLYREIFRGSLKQRLTAFRRNKVLNSFISTLTDITSQYYEFITKKVFEYNGEFSHQFVKQNTKSFLHLYNYATSYSGRQMIQPRLDEFGTVEFRMSKCELNYTRLMREILIAQLIVKCAKKGIRFDYKLAKKIYYYSKSYACVEQAS